MKTRFRTGWLNYAILLTVIFAALAVACAVGSVSLSLTDSIKLILSKIPFVNNFVDVSGISEAHGIIVFKLRMPRAITALLVGGALSICGAALQGLFQNPLTDAGILGVSSGASLGVGVAATFTFGSTVMGVSVTTLFAFAGASGSVFLVYYLARIHGKTSVISLILSGTAISTFASSMLTAMMVLNLNTLERIFTWTMGSLSASNWRNLSLSFPIIFIGSLLLIFRSRELDIMLLGQEEARHVGINVDKFRREIMIVSALTCAAAISMTGVIGFVGLMIPHMLRTFTGPGHKKLLPMSFLCGGLFLLVVDTLARVVAHPREVPVGIITGILGVPFFIYLLRKRGLR